MSGKDLQDQQCEYAPQALSEPASMISCLLDHFLDHQLLPTPHLYYLYFARDYRHSVFELHGFFPDSSTSIVAKFEPGQ